MICCADAILSSKASRKRFKPDLIVHFSHNPVSSTLLKALDEWVDVPMIRFVREGDGQPETTGTATLNTSEEMSETELLFSFHPVVVVPQGAKMVFSSQNRDAMAEVRAADAQWLATWQKAEIQVRKVVSAELEQSQKLTDPHVFYHLSQKIRGFGVMVSNSFPVRDMALFGMYNAGETINRQNTDEHHTLQVPFCGQYVNRGAAGIDGILSTAAGLAFASSGTAGSAGNAGSTGKAGSAGNAGTSGSAGSAGSVGNAIASTYRNAWACFMGDLAFLHDSNALMVLNQLQLPLIVFVINNGGGTIFRMLPVAGHTDIYKDFFETPQQVSIRHLALAHNLAYDRIESLHELLRWTPPPAPDAPLIVELCTDADESMKIRTAIKHAMSDAMNDATHDAMSEPTDDAAKSTNGKEG